MKKVCKWFYSCPIQRFVEEGKLEGDWLEKYCLVGNKNCERFKKEEKGINHPDNMLPNGEIREDLE